MFSIATSLLLSSYYLLFPHIIHNLKFHILKICYHLSILIAVFKEFWLWAQKLLINIVDYFNVHRDDPLITWCGRLYFPKISTIIIYSIIYAFLWEKSMAPHSSTLAWKIPWTEEPGRLQSMGSLRVGHGWATSLSLFTFMHWRRKWQPTPVFLPGESQGWRGLVRRTQ